MSSPLWRAMRSGVLAAVLSAGLAAPAYAIPTVPVQQVSSDPFPTVGSLDQHATEVEPDTFTHGSTVVSAFQTGRFFNGGASDIGWATSTDGGSTWSHGFLPSMTAESTPPATQYERVSDASVAYDAAHGVWLISSIPLRPSLSVPTIDVNRSSDGLNWESPVSIPAPVANKVDLDKNWTVCDNTASQFRGHCYTEFDNFGQGDLEYMSTSTDGGRSWSAPVATAGNDKGLGGQPVVQPDGTVVVPFESLNGKIAAFSSHDGGQTWARAVTISAARTHDNSGGLRTSPLPTAEVAGDGTVYVAWQDCRFELKCSANDIVISKSADGANWSTPSRIPIDPIGSGVDHFIPGLGVDASTSGTATHLALTYYFYPDSSCTPATCRLSAATVSSPDGGSSWGGKTQLVGPMSLSDIASTSQGTMVGDYISTSFVAGGRYTTVVADGRPHTGSVFDEAMYAPLAPLPVATTGLTPASSAGAAPITGQGNGTTAHLLRQN